MPNRRQLRKQFRSLRRARNKGQLDSFKVVPGSSNSALVYASSRMYPEASQGVTASLFGTSVKAVEEVSASLNASNYAYDSLVNHVDNLLSFQPPEDFRKSVSSALDLAKKFMVFTAAYCENPVVLSVGGRFPSSAEITEKFRLQYNRILKVPKDVETSGMSDSFAPSYLEYLSSLRKHVEGNMPILKTRLNIVGSLEDVLKNVGRVAEEGSPLAAQLFFSRMVGLFVPEAAEDMSRRFLGKPVYLVSHALLQVKNKPLSKLRGLSQIDFTAFYKGIGKLGLDGILAALDKEERRTRYAGRFRADFYKLNSFMNTPIQIFRLGDSLKKVGAAPESAQELIEGAPLGRRHYVFGALLKRPSDVRLYELIKPYGVDAGGFLQFLTDLGSVSVKFGAKKVVLMDALADIVKDESHRKAAAWILCHPDVLDGNDISNVLLLAQRSAEPVGSSAANVANPVRHSQGLKAGLKPRPRGPIWPQLSYRENPRLVDLVFDVYDVVPLHLQHRVKQVDNYVREHFHKAHEEKAGLYFSAISEMSPKLLRLIFSNDRFFDAALKRMSDRGFVSELEEAVNADGNPYSALYKLLVHQPKISAGAIFSSISEIAIKDAEQGGCSDSSNADGVVYRFAVLGEFSKLAVFSEDIGKKLDGTGVEVVFVSPRHRGVQIDCDGVLIHGGGSAHTKHNTVSMSYYERHKIPTRFIREGYGVNSVAQAALNFRDELVKGRSSERLSA